MEKLELKHLAPYLPYRLNFIVQINDVWPSSPKEERKLELRGGNIRLAMNFGKPILRPLSDLTKEIEHNGERFKISDIPEVKTNPGSEYNCAVIWRDRDKNLLNCEYWFVEILIKYHFDVFGLIEKGLAIDINTLESNKP